MVKTEPYLIWIMGIAGSGKSQVSKNICEEFLTEGVDIVWIDGDDLRKRLYLVGHTPEDRTKFGKIYLNICRMFLDINYNVVLSSIGLNLELQNYAKSVANNYIQIKIDASINFLESLGHRSIYSNEVVNVMGKDLIPDTLDFDFTVVNDGSSTLRQITTSIKNFISNTMIN